MIYSKFNDNNEDNEEILVGTTNTTTTVPNSTSANMDISATTNTSTPAETESFSTEVPLQRMHSSSYANSLTNLTAGPTVFTPYINRTYLKNLDTATLERNMQVRHDLMVEEGYRASLPSRQGFTEENEQHYWQSIRLEVAELQLPEVKNAPRLAALISEIREMMIELYPRCELVVGEFAEFLEDTEFILQQLKRGALDIKGFFQFLGHVMKKNCAPKRDSMVDAMISCDCPIEGLNKALKLIELMKLDLANFKLDQLRPIIAKTAVSTERAFFSQLFANGKISLDLTKIWLSYSFPVENDSSVVLSGYEAYLNAGIKLLISPFVRETCSVPETFILDKKRLIFLHGKFQDLCIVQCLLLIFKQTCAERNMRRSFTSNLLKGELLRLLEQPDTQISDISNLLIKCLKDSQIYSVDFDYIHSALNKIISPENELFLMVESKLIKRIKAKLSQTANSNSSIEPAGLSDLNVLDEIDCLTKKFGILLQYNWNVFEPIYQNLLNNKQ